MKTLTSKVTDVTCVDGKKHKWDKTIENWAWCTKCGSITIFRKTWKGTWVRRKEKSVFGKYTIGVPLHLVK